MTVTIHPTAIIEPGAELDEGVAVGAYSIVGPEVKLGKNVTLKSHVVIGGSTTVGEGTEIFPFASIGLIPQDKKYHGEKSGLVIGKNNIIREYVTMNPGTEGGGMETRIGDNGLFMVSCHVAHDCQIGNNVVMVNNATLAGHVNVGDFAVIGGLSAVHQFVRIGTHAMIGGMSAVESDVIPFGVTVGERAWLAGLNIVGLKRRGFERKTIHALRGAYKQLFAADSGRFEERVKDVAEAFKDEPVIAEIIAFLSLDSSRAICQPKQHEID